MKRQRRPEQAHPDLARERTVERLLTEERFADAIVAAYGRPGVHPLPGGGVGWDAPIHDDVVRRRVGVQIDRAILTRIEHILQQRQEDQPA